MSRLSSSSLHAAIIVGVSILLYLPSLKADFVWDDISYVKRNTLVRQWKQIPLSFYDRAPSSGGADAPIYRPVRNVSYIVDYKLWGLDPSGYHLQNIFWHAVVVLLVYFITRELCGSATAAFCGALLFASHPILTESVAWIKGRDALLSAAFGLGACFIFLRARHAGIIREAAAPLSVNGEGAGGEAIGASPEHPHPPTPSPCMGRGSIFAALALFALAIFAYPMAMLFPVAFILLYWMFPGPDGAGHLSGAFRARSRFVALSIIIGSSAIAILFLVIRRLVIGQTAQCPYLVGGSFIKTMIAMIPVAFEYLRLLVFPLRLNADYITYPHYQSLLAGPVLLGIATIVGYLLAVWISWRRQARLVLFSLLWIPLFLALVSNVIPTMQLLAERFLYLPAVALSFMTAAAWLAVEKRPQRWARYLWIGVFGIVVAAFFIRSYERLAVWRDEVALYADTWRADRNNVRAMGNYGEALFNSQRYKEAIGTLEQLQKKTGGLGPKTWRALAFSYARLGDRARALDLLEEGLKGNPNSGLLYVGIALLASETGQTDRARLAVGQVEDGEGLDAQNQFLLGVVHMNLAMYPQAERVFLKLEPEWPANDPNLFRNLARAAYHQEKWARAREYYTRVLRLKPEDEEARSLLPDIEQRLRQTPFSPSK